VLKKGHKKRSEEQENSHLGSEERKENGEKMGEATLSLKNENNEGDTMRESGDKREKEVFVSEHKLLNLSSHKNSCLHSYIGVHARRAAFGEGKYKGNLPKL
jgi:hypothetical protein